MTAAVVGAFGPMLSPGFVVIAQDLGVSVNVMSQSTAYAVLSIGLSLFLVSPIAKVYGRRPMFMLSAVVMLATSIWGGFSTSYSSLLGARVVAGIGMAPYETLVQCIIGDIYFVHERATRIAIWNLFLLAGLNGGSIVAGYIIEASGFRWAFGACGILFGVLTISTFFLIPETAYRRDNLAPVVTVEEDGSKGLHMRPKYQINLQGDDYEGRYLEISARERRRTFWERLHIFSGRYSSSPLWKVFLRSLVMVFYPAVLWAFLSYGPSTLLVMDMPVRNGEKSADRQVRDRNNNQRHCTLLCCQPCCLRCAPLQLHRQPDWFDELVTFHNVYTGVRHRRPL